MDEPAATYYVIDRFEDNDWAVLETEQGTTFNVPRSWVPDAAEEGDVLKLLTETEFDELERDPSFRELYFSVDFEEGLRRRERAKALRATLKQGPKGNFEL